MGLLLCALWVVIAFATDVDNPLLGSDREWQILSWFSIAVKALWLFAISWDGWCLVVGSVICSIHLGYNYCGLDLWLVNLMLYVNN